VPGRRKRATTVSPERLVKSTKKRPVVSVSGENARPSNPCSPPETIADDRSRKVGTEHRRAAHHANVAVLLDDELY
jgi:hypothetical protein